MSDTIERLSNENNYSGLCSVWRVKRVAHMSMDMLTGAMTPKSEETVIERCGIPLFDNTAKICRSCKGKWEAEGNRFATDEEITKWT